MKLLCIFPSTGRFYISSNIHNKQPNAFLPPLGLLYLARMVELQGHSVEIIDYNAESFDDTTIQKAVHSADAIGMTIFSEPREFQNSITIANKIRQFSPDIPIIVGGPHCMFFPEQTLRDHHADICVQGEGEYIIGPLLEALEGKGELSSIPGLIFQQNGEIHKTKSNEQIMNLDNLPFPSRHLVKKYEYGYIYGKKTMKGKVTSLISSRGCPNRCTFCQITCFTHYRARSATNSIKEIDELVLAGYNSIAFADDNFLADKKKAEYIMDHIIKQQYDISLWILDTRIDSADKKLYQKMRDAGVELISFGIESGNQEILDLYNKKITIEQVRKTVKLSKEMGFLLDVNFILGAPIETKKQMENTIRFAKSLSIDHVLFNHLQYLAGTPLWKQAVKQGKINPEESTVKSDKRRGLALYDSKEIDNFCRNAYFSFYSNPRYWIREINYALRNHDPRILQLGLRRFFKIF
ncbi:MAG: radical SAM protein [Euryarchaeota archaeon]|nr:radical SAM protein [Euryarchaeota archaeon]